MRLWYLICLVLFIESISILIDERFDVTYHLEYDPNWNQSIEYSSCVNLNKIYEDRSEFRLIESNEIYQYFKSLKDISKNAKELIFKKIESKNYFIYKELFCIITSKEESKILHKFIYYFVYNNENYQFLKLKKINLRFNEIIINDLESPYSDCKIKKFSRFKCLNNCNRKNNRLAKYYYHGKEIGNETFKLIYNKNNHHIKIDEFICLKECKKQGDDCKLVVFKEKYNDRENSNTTIFTAYPSISEFDYWIQFIGLICFFTNLCLYYLLTKLIKFIGNNLRIPTIRIKKYRIKINLKNCLNYFKFIILSIWLLFLSLLIRRMINEYLNERDYPIKKEITTTELNLKSINLVICIPFKDLPNYTIKTLSELENETSKLDLFGQHIEGIYLEYLSKKIKIDYQLNDEKILFKSGRRCYQIEIYPNAYRYQNQLLITKLSIQFKDKIKGKNKDKIKEDKYVVYLLSDDKIFHLKRYDILSNYLFVKKEIKRSKLNKINRCEDNDKIKLNFHYKCIRSEYIDKNKNIPSKLIVDKDQFTNDEWTKLSIDHTYNYKNGYFDKCVNNKSIQLNCFETILEKYLKKDNILDNKLTLEFYNDVIKEIDEEPSIYKLLMDILNIQSILFGLNMFNAIIIILNYKLIKFKNNKLLIYLLCLIGFTYHLWFIFDEIINEELIYSQHYKLEETFKIPNLIFCLKYNQNSINSNYKLTYKYLDKITNHININRLIEEIKYLDESNSWNQFNNSNIDKFYFLDQKCFEIKLNLEYKFDQFEFKENYKNDVIRVPLLRELSKKEGIHYLNRLSETMQFSKLNTLSSSNEMSIELMEIDYEDKFTLIKNPLSLIYGQNYVNDVNKYLNNLIDNFKINYNLATLNLPLNNSNDLEIDDQLFDQFYLQVQNLTDYNQSSNPNFKRTFIISNKDFSSNWLYIEINLIFYKKIIKITNEDNYTKLILNLLNLLSLWFNIGLFDLHKYFGFILIKIKPIFIFFYKFSIEIKCRLFIKLDLFENSNPLND